MIALPSTEPKYGNEPGVCLSENLVCSLCWKGRRAHMDGTYVRVVYLWPFISLILTSYVSDPRVNTIKSAGSSSLLVPDSRLS